VACFAEDGYLDHLWQGKLHGHDKLRRAFEELWYDRPSWWIGRQHLANHFLITREGEGARVKALFSILQYNVDYRPNFVFWHWELGQLLREEKRQLALQNRLHQCMDRPR
jgi:hypothetical protein